MPRDNWCTPKWLANALGTFDVDPCSNERSWVNARTLLGDVWGNDGLNIALSSSFSYFVNPPYSRGQVVQWVNAYKGTDFTFLLRWDPSTAWYRDIMTASECVWFAHQRINFEPPPGVKSGSNPFPHALYFRHWPTGQRAHNLANLGRFWRVREPGDWCNPPAQGDRP